MAVRASPEFRQLKARLLELRQRFLPRRFSATGTYNDKTLDYARAYRILAHAEIEHFLERRVEAIAASAFQVWASTGKATPVLVALMCARTSGEGMPKAIGTNRTGLTLVGKAVGQFKVTVAQNHGIRTPNILELLLPVGVEEAQLDVVWLATTDGFGAKRGAAAHSSAVSYVIDPRNDYQTVGQIMAGLLKIDALLNVLKKAAQ